AVSGHSDMRALESPSLDVRPAHADFACPSPCANRRRMKGWPRRLQQAACRGKEEKVLVTFCALAYGDSHTPVSIRPFASSHWHLASCMRQVASAYLHLRISDLTSAAPRP